MSKSKQADVLINHFLDMVDNVSFKLEEAGIDAPHRHDVIALLANGQVRLNGELDSLEAKWDQLKVKATRIATTSEKLVFSAIGLMLLPTSYALNRLQERF